MRQVYADHAATTPLHPKVAEAMLAFMTEAYGNPSSVHAFGRRVKKALEEAREQVAALIGAQPPELFFTSGGTEADNWAIKGVALANRAKGRHLITSPIEHSAIRDAIAHLVSHEGFEVTELPVDQSGRVDVTAFADVVRPETILCSVMLANNEVGSLQAISQLAQLCRRAGVILHTDAVQAVGQVPIDVKALDVDLLSLSAHKLYGPKGVGALYARRGFRFGSLIHGGGQERQLRPGTENAPGIIGFGQAAALAQAELPARAEHLMVLRDRFVLGLQGQLPGVELNGPPLAGGRLPGLANLAFAGIDGETLLLQLDLRGIAASAGSACSSGSLQPSPVLRAMGLPPERVAGSLRFSFGLGNSLEDVDYLIETITALVTRLRGLGVKER